jgi:hypothetical protein
MKLVLLEALVVLIAWRAAMSLLGRAPHWSAPLWDFFAGLALVAAASILVDAARKRMPRFGAVAPPHIPLERIGPFRMEAMLVRNGARGEHQIHLN